MSEEQAQPEGTAGEPVVAEQEATKAPTQEGERILTEEEKEQKNSELFQKIKAAPEVYRKVGEHWEKIQVVQPHSKQLKFYGTTLHEKKFFEVDFETMQLEKPEGYVDPPRATSAHSTALATIPGQNYGNSAVSRQPGSGRNYTTRRYRHVTQPKPSHGFAGLQNQGATCYLNSLLQTFYMTVELRKALFDWRHDEKGDGSDKTRVMTLQLQELFARLQHSEQGSQPTKALTTSFGWSGSEVYQQHDVVELCQVMFDHLREHSHDETLQSIVNEFTCNISDYLACMTCQNTRSNEQPVVGVPLPIEGPDVNTLDEALRKYADFEVLDEDNAVMCSVCECKQPSKKGVSFKSFGKFLPIQLNRWTLNFNTLQREKIHKVIQFDTTLDVAPYLKNIPPEGTQYQLYSMMIHRGGAYGGHYFAYIKDFETNKWYEFNDSRVSEIPEAEFEKMMNPELATQQLKSTGSGGYYRTSPLTGAYMLVYRRVQDDNINNISDDAIPPQLIQQIDSQDEKWKKDVTEIDLYVWYTNEDSKDTVIFSRDETLESQLDTLKQKFSLPEDTRAEDIRFRRVVRDNLAEPFDDIALDFVSLGLDAGAEVAFEVKAPEEEFEAYQPKMKSYRVHCLDKIEMKLKEPETVEVPESGTTADLRRECAKLLGVEPGQCKMLFEYSYEQDKSLDEFSRGEMTISTPTIRMVNDVYAEECADYQDENEPSIIDGIYEERRHQKTYTYNSLDGSNTQLVINLDDRISIKDLREKLAQQLSVAPMEFKIKNKNGNEVKDLDIELHRSKIERNILYLEPGTPMDKGDYIINLSFDTGANGEERFMPLHNNFVINEEWGLEELKDAVVEHCSTEQELPPKDLMRFRRKGMKEQLKDFVPHDKPLKSLPVLCSDGSDLVLQPLSQPEQLHSKKDIIVNICRYHPETQSLGDPEEIVMGWKLRVKDGVRAFLEDWTKGQIEPENLRYFKPVTFYHISLKNLCNVDWDLSKVSESDVIYQSPWRMKSGDYLLYKDNSEKEPERPETQYEGMGMGGHGVVSNRMRAHRQERGIKIFTAQEQEERNKEQAGGSSGLDVDIN